MLASVLARHAFQHVVVRPIPAASLSVSVAEGQPIAGLLLSHILAMDHARARS